MSPDEARAIREENARADACPADQQTGIQWCQNMLARLGPDDRRLNTLDQAGAGDCGECGRHTHALRTLGRYHLCTDCLQRRLAAAAQAQPTSPPAAASFVPAHPTAKAAA